jgi:Flagellar hook-length control protein FliK
MGFGSSLYGMGLVFHPSSDHTRTDVDFTAADRAQSLSSASGGGSVRTAQSGSSHPDGSIRKSFSTVLQRVQGEEGRDGTREVDEARSVKHSEAGSQSKETRGLHASKKTERSGASPSQIEERRRSSDDEEKTAAGSKVDRELSTQGSGAVSGDQVQAPAPIPSLISSQAIPQVIDQAEIHTEIGHHSSDDKTGSVAGLPKPPLISLTTADAPETVSQTGEAHPSSNGESAPSYGPPQLQSATPVIQARTDPQADQAVKQGPDAVIDDRGAEETKGVETRPVPKELQLGAVPPPSDPVVRRAFEVYLGGVAADGKPEVSKTDAMKQEGVPLNRSIPAPADWHEQSSSDPVEMGAKLRSVFPNGQQPSVDTAAQFSQLWSDEHIRQQDYADTKLPQGATVDLQAVNGRGVEPFTVGAYAQNSAVPAPPTLSLAAQTPPSTRADDSAQPPLASLMRSVVLDVAQPDLGHLNVRVSMTNDLVHTHLLSDRPEVGQFLVNGQDRLQAALQASGFDMGQFRVDIDRQSAGRSFQHGQSQEQGQGWNQHSPGMGQEQHADRQGGTRASLHGLLNVVA